MERLRGAAGTACSGVLRNTRNTGGGTTMTRPPQLNPNPVKTAEEIAAVLRLKRGGMTVRQIAAELGLSPTTVQRRLDAGIEATVSPEVEELRVSETARLGALTKALAKGVKAGDVPAISESRRIGESLRRLHGVDAPAVTVVQLEQRNDLDANLVADALSAGLAAVFKLAGWDAQWEREAHGYAMASALRVLDPSTPVPEAPRQRLAITAGASAPPPAAPPEPEPTAGPPEGLTPAERAVLDDALADAEQPRPDRVPKDDPAPPKIDPPASKDDTSGWPPELRRRMSPMSKIIG
ncbi:helix-turn-helix domain-containing protein [Streptacidiphilus sp. PAMC 29251]